MVHRFKANVKEAAYRREELITQLEHGLIFHSDSDSHDDTDTTVYHIVYDLCGFLIKSRRSLMSCDVCYEAATREEHELPTNFNADAWTAIKNRGVLHFAV